MQKRIVADLENPDATATTLSGCEGLLAAK
jgi:hypothetical protein